MKHLALALTILGAAPAIAFAQGDDTGMGGAPAQTTTPTTASPGSEPGAMSPTGSPPEIFHHGTMGLSFDVATTASNPVIDLTYFTDPATAYDIIFGLSYAHTQSMTTGMPPVTTPGADLFGFTLGLGYRMYRHHSSKVHLYLEPEVVLATTDVSNFGDTVSLEVGLAAGVEAMFTDWFSISGQVGADLAFTNKFNVINLATFRDGLFANFYWQ